MELKKVALFDLDGVVLDTEGQYTVFWQTIGERYCTEVPDFATRIKGMSLVQILASHEKLQQHEQEIRKAIDEYEEILLSGKSFTRQKNKAETLLWDFSLFCYFACCKKKL